MLVGGLTETIVAWLDGHLDVTIDQLIADATALFQATTEATRTITSRRHGAS